MELGFTKIIVANAKERSFITYIVDFDRSEYVFALVCDRISQATFDDENLNLLSFFFLSFLNEVDL